jgi:exodeoxyribonuclease III
VRVATWNVNSAKQRLPRLLPWLDERQPDVVCLQETKLAGCAGPARQAPPIPLNGGGPRGGRSALGRVR